MCTHPGAEQRLKCVHVCTACLPVHGVSCIFQGAADDGGDGAEEASILCGPAVGHCRPCSNSSGVEAALSGIRGVSRKSALTQVKMPARQLHPAGQRNPTPLPESMQGLSRTCICEQLSATAQSPFAAMCEQAARGRRVQ